MIPIFETRDAGKPLTIHKASTIQANRITGDGPLIPVILRLAAPVVLMMYLQNAYNIIDTIWVGQLLGKVALAGISTGGYVLWILIGLAGLVSTGLTATIARRMGEGNIEEAEKMAARGLWYAFGVSVIIGIIVYALLPAIFRMMATDAEVTGEGLAYITILIIGLPTIFLSFAITSMFQASGDTITPMWLVAVSLVINTALDPVLMLGLFGMPKMGIAGAALATVVARLAWVVIGVVLLYSGKRIGQMERGPSPLGFLRRALPSIKPGPLRLNPRKKHGWNWPQFLSILRIGLPHAFSMTLFPLVYMLLIRIPAQYGAHQIAALRVGHTAEGMSFFLAMGFSIATATLVGQNMGAGKIQRARKAAWVSATVVAIILSVYSACFLLLPKGIASIFTPDADTIAASAVYLIIVAWSQLFMGVEIVLGGGFTGSGDTWPPMLVAVPLNLGRIPLAYFLADTMGWGVIGVWWAISATTIVKGIILALWFLTGRWAKKRI